MLKKVNIRSYGEIWKKLSFFLKLRGQYIKYFMSWFVSLKSVIEPKKKLKKNFRLKEI